MHPETQLQALADAGVEGTSIFQDVGISVPSWSATARAGLSLTLSCAAAIPSPSPLWTGSAATALDLVGVVESLHRRGVGLASLAPAES